MCDIIIPVGGIIIEEVLYMKKAVIDANLCDQSPFCPVIRVCPVKAVKQEKASFFRGATPVVDHDECTGCSKCVNYCPHGAVKIINK